MAQHGGVGVVHKNMTIERQAEEVDKVKRSESGMIVDPVTARPDQLLRDAYPFLKGMVEAGFLVRPDGAQQSPGEDRR